jgi:hypothetical protein
MPHQAYERNHKLFQKYLTPFDFLLLSTILLTFDDFANSFITVSRKGISEST